MRKQHWNCSIHFLYSMMIIIMFNLIGINTVSSIGDDIYADQIEMTQVMQSSQITQLKCDAAGVDAHESLIILSCPITESGICRENCNNFCSFNDSCDDVLTKAIPRCIYQSITSNQIQIKYLINTSTIIIPGLWWCSFRGKRSDSVTVNPTVAAVKSPRLTVTTGPIINTTRFIETPLDTHPAVVAEDAYRVYVSNNYILLLLVVVCMSCLLNLFFFIRCCVLGNYQKNLQLGELRNDCVERVCCMEQSRMRNYRSVLYESRLKDDKDFNRGNNRHQIHSNTISGFNRSRPIHPERQRTQNWNHHIMNCNYHTMSNQSAHAVRSNIQQLQQPLTSLTTNELIYDEVPESHYFQTPTCSYGDVNTSPALPVHNYSSYRTMFHKSSPLYQYYAQGTPKFKRPALCNVQYEQASPINAVGQGNYCLNYEIASSRPSGGYNQMSNMNNHFTSPNQHLLDAAGYGYQDQSKQQIWYGPISYPQLVDRKYATVNGKLKATIPCMTAFDRIPEESVTPSHVESNSIRRTISPSYSIPPNSSNKMESSELCNLFQLSERENELSLAVPTSTTNNTCATSSLSSNAPVSIPTGGDAHNKDSKN